MPNTELTEESEPTTLASKVTLLLKISFFTDDKQRII
jgi:hypothetical protein